MTSPSDQNGFAVWLMVGEKFGTDKVSIRDDLRLGNCRKQDRIP